MLLVCGCKSENPDSIFKRLSEDDTGIDFENTIQETDQDNVLNYEYFYNGGGVASGDFNNDGFIDLYFTANQGPDKLYLNKGNQKGKLLQFEDITESAGITWNGEWKTGVTVVDLNGDGWLDIYVSVSGNVDKPVLRKNKLYINNKNLTFTERAADYGLDLNTYTTQTTFFDYDRDGDLDAYLLNHNVVDFNRFDVQAVHAMRDTLAGDRLLRNDDGKFVDVSAEAGIKGKPDWLWPGYPHRRSERRWLAGYLRIQRLHRKRLPLHQQSKRWLRGHHRPKDRPHQLFLDGQ